MDWLTAWHRSKSCDRAYDGVRARRRGIDTEFRAIVRHAREMHDLLLEELAANERLATEYMRGLSDAAANAIEHLEALTALPDGRMQ
jgi:hypothetical protein